MRPAATRPAATGRASRPRAQNAGISLLETVASLALLSLILVYVAHTAVLHLRASARVVGEGSWRSGARATLRMMHDDLRCGDFPKLPAPTGLPWTVTTRGPQGALRNVYELDDGGRLSVESGAGAEARTRTLLEEVASLDFRAQEDALTVRITSLDGHVEERTIRVP